MSIQTAGAITIVAPAGVDGFGGTAVLNNSASGDFVGYLEKVSGFGGAQVRTSSEDVPEGHGAVFGTQYYGARPFTIEARLKIASSYANSDARFNKLVRAWNAMASDGTIDWTDNDGYTKRISFRQEQPPGDPGEDGIVLLGGRAADPRIYRTTASTPSATTGTNNGNAFSPPHSVLFTPTANGTVIITNTTSGLGNPALTVTVGTGGVTAGGGAVTVNFANRTVTQGTRKDYAVVFSSTWWEVAPGVNTWTFTGTATYSANTVSFYDAWLSG